MAYSALADVQNEFKKMTFDSTTSITDTQVNDWIAQADAEIDSIVGLRYIVPITGVNSLLILKRISVEIVAERIKDVLEVKTDEKVSQNIRNINKVLTARDKLKLISTGDMLLSDALIAGSNAGVTSFTSSNGVEHKFRAGEDQW